MIDHPVPSAFERSTDSVPSTTQKPCWRPALSAMYTARPSPAAPRTAFWNQTDPTLACSTTICSADSSAVRAAPGCTSSSTSISGTSEPLASSAYAPIWRAEYVATRMRNGCSSESMSGTSGSRRTTARATPSRAMSRAAKSGRTFFPSSRSALARNTPAAAASASSSSGPVGSIGGRTKERSQSSSSGIDVSAAVGAVGPVGRCCEPSRRRPSASTAARAPSPAAVPSMKPATARSVSATERARSARVRVGHSSMTAQMPAPTAMPQPSSRCGMTEFAAGIVTGRTNVRIAPVAPAAKYPPSTPEKSVANPTAAITTAPIHGVREQSVPRVM